MAKKIAGEYIAELQVEFDKKSQVQQGKQLFNQHVANLHQQNNHTIKQAEKTAEESTKASFKGAEKGVNKSKGKIGGIFKALSRVVNTFSKTFSKIPIFGSFLTSLAGGFRLLSYDPTQTIGEVSNVANEGLQTLNYGNLLGIDPSKLNRFLDSLQRKGLSKQNAIGLVSQVAGRTGSNNIDDIISYINDALGTFSNTNDLISKESVAKAYGINANTLASLQSYNQLASSGNIEDNAPETLPTTQDFYTESTFAIENQRKALNKSLREEDTIINELNDSMNKLLVNIDKINNIDIEHFTTQLNNLDTQVAGYTINRKIQDSIDNGIAEVFKGLSSTVIPKTADGVDLFIRTIDNAIKKRLNSTTNNIGNDYTRGSSTRLPTPDLSHTHIPK